nr:isochorismate synthase [Microbacterium endophyticum]
MRVVTREVATIEDVLPFTDASTPLVWQRTGDGFVGAGPLIIRLDESAHLPHGERARNLATRWRSLVNGATIDDDVHLPGSGLVAFGALAFDDGSEFASSLLVPSVIVGRRGSRSWVTRISREDEAPAPRETPYGPHWAATVGPGKLDPADHQKAVREALEAIRSGVVSKVVVARDLRGTLPGDADLRRLVRALATGYPDTWAFAVDGLIGASPETLVTVSSGTVTARVLAGTAARGADPDSDAAASVALVTSAKDQDEHRYAVQSVLASLSPLAPAVVAGEQPFVLKLPNVWHLATDIEGTLTDAASALDLVAALHPTAAVAGTPTDSALELISRLETFDRGRYAGPVGWIDAAGDGEWAIALRCAQIGPRDGDMRSITAHAGGGIVAGSDPESELLETRVKFRPIVDALA